MIERELPESLAGLGVLELLPPGEKAAWTGTLAERGVSEPIASDTPTELLGQYKGSFDLILCRDPFVSRLHPVAMLADLWRLAAPDATLLLESEILEEEAHSALARFRPTGALGAGWIPGRLTVRWTVEVAGFDVKRWIEQPDDRVNSRTALRAVRAEREPASSAP